MELNSRWTVPLKQTNFLTINKMYTKFFYHILLITVLVIQISYLDPHPHLESAFAMRIPDADPGDRNHADPCR